MKNLKLTVCAISLLLAPVVSLAQTGVFVAPVKQEMVYDVVESVGTAKAFNSVTVTSEVPSKVTKVHFEEGQKVAEGNLLFTLNNNEEKADLAAAESAFIQKKKSFERAKNLVKTNVISDATFQEREAEYETEKANVQAVKARVDLQEIRAPFAGTVGILDLSVGEFIQAGEVMVNLSDLSRMKVDFNVPSRYLSMLKVGDELQAKTGAYEKLFKGKVSFIDQQVDQNTRTVRLRAIIPNPESLLKDGMLMTIKTFTSPRQSFTIPEEALIKRGEENFVFKIVEEEGQTKAKYQPIQIGSRSYGTLEVLSGLTENDKVIHHGVMKVKDGAPVVVKATEEGDATLQEMLQKA